MPTKLKFLIIDTPVNFGGTVVFKCSGPLQEYMSSNPDVEFKYNMYADPVDMAWADVIWVEPCEYAAILASKRRYDDETCRFWNDSENRFGKGEFRDWSKAKLIVRGIDIDILFCHYTGVHWNNVDHFLFIDQHIHDHAFRDPSIYPDSLKVDVIPLGFDTRKYTYRERDPKGNYKIAFVAELWNGKNIPMAIQAFYALASRTGQPWTLHILGRWSGERMWLEPYMKSIIKELGIEDRVFHTETVADMDAWLEDKDYSISASSKEAFALVTAEAAAKGMKPLTHAWPGARELWPDEFIWKSIDEFVEKMCRPINSARNREIAMQYDFTTKILPRLKEIIFSPK